MEKSSLVEKLGSEVELTPNLLKPALSPGIGIWVTNAN